MTYTNATAPNLVKLHAAELYIALTPVDLLNKLNAYKNFLTRLSLYFS